MNFIVINPMPNGKYLVQLMNENQYNALKTAGVITEDTTVYETDMTMDDIADSGIIGMHTEDEIIQYVKDNSSNINHVEGPPFDDGTGDTD